MDQTNLDIYGHPPIPWSRAERQLEASAGQDTRHFLSTVRPDGRPHVAGIGGLWVDDRFYFVSGAGTRKSRNLAARADCVHLDALARPRPRGRRDRAESDRPADARASRRALRRAGLAGGRRRRRGDRALQRAERGPPPWDLYEFTPRTAFGVGSGEPHGAMRWDFQVEGTSRI